MVFAAVDRGMPPMQPWWLCGSVIARWGGPIALDALPKARAKEETGDFTPHSFEIVSELNG